MYVQRVPEIVLILIYRHLPASTEVDFGTQRGREHELDVPNTSTTTTKSLIMHATTKTSWIVYKSSVWYFDLYLGSSRLSLLCHQHTDGYFWSVSFVVYLSLNYTMSKVSRPRWGMLTVLSSVYKDSSIHRQSEFNLADFRPCIQGCIRCDSHTMFFSSQTNHLANPRTYQ